MRQQLCGIIAFPQHLLPTSRHHRPRPCATEKIHGFLARFLAPTPLQVYHPRPRANYLSIPSAFSSAPLRHTEHRLLPLFIVRKVHPATKFLGEATIHDNKTTSCFASIAISQHHHHHAPMTPPRCNAPNDNGCANDDDNNTDNSSNSIAVRTPP